MNRLARAVPSTPLRLAAVLAVVFTLMYVGYSSYNQLAAQNLVTCPGLVQEAINTVGNNCGSLNRNSACYGFQQVVAEFNQPQPADFFNKPSDRAGLTDLERLDTLPMNEALGLWGVALLSVQANLPDTLPGQSVIFMLLGDTQVENAVNAEDAFQTGATINVTVMVGAQLFHDPAMNSPVVGTIPQGTALTADAISADGQWVRVAYQGVPGWVTQQVISSEGDLTTLPEIGPTPVQAFYFRTSISGTQCSEAPNALVVQGPQNVAVDITANGANIRLGSTIALYLLPVDAMTQAFLTQQYGNIGMITELMQLVVLDGHVTLNAGTPDEITLETGETSFICLSDPENLGADGQENDRHVFDLCPWAPPRPVTLADIERFRALEGFTLNYPVDLPLDLPTVTPSPSSIPAATRITGGGVIIRTATPTPTNTPVPPPSGDGGSNPTAVPPSAIPATATQTPTEPPACPDEDFFINSGDTQHLIDAINHANDEVCFPGANTITLSGETTYGLTTPDNEVDGLNALPSITSTIIIEGNDSTITSGKVPHRYFHIASSGSLTLNNIYSIQAGNASSNYGGAIFNRGTLSIKHTQLQNNSSSLGGGAIYNAGTLSLSHVTIQYNDTAGDGGGLYNAGTASLDSTTFAYNNAYTSGGGIYNSGTLRTLNTTISSNFGTFGGGAINSVGASTLNFTTIYQNGSETGASVIGAVAARNSIIAGDSPNCDSSVTSLGGSFNDDGSCSGFAYAEALYMDGLGYNGGSTQTHALYASSDPIDRVDCTTDTGATVSIDQRGEARPYDGDGTPAPGECDAGAFENHGEYGDV